MSKAAQINPDGSVVKVINTNKGVNVGDGDEMIQYPKSIWTMWSDDKLNAIGYAKFNEDMMPPGKQSTGYTDTFNGQVTRTHTLEAIPTPPDPQDTDSSAPGYDVNYADNYQAYRADAYNEAGVTISSLSIALWEAEGQDEADNTERDRLRLLRQAVKVRYPKPVG